MTGRVALAFLFLAVLSAPAMAQSGDFQKDWAREVDSGRAGQEITDRTARQLIGRKLNLLDGKRQWKIVLEPPNQLGNRQFSATTKTVDGPFTRRGSIAMKRNPRIGMFGYTGAKPGLGRVSITTKIWRGGRYVAVPGPSAPVRTSRFRSVRSSPHGSVRAARAEKMRSRPSKGARRAVKVRAR